MKAVVYYKYGPPEVLHTEDIEKPVPRDTEVLIKNIATSAHVGDTRIRSFRVPALYWLPSRLFLGIFKPRKKVLGMEVAGIVESVGSKVTNFKKGNEVFALTGFKFGGYAEYSTVYALDGNDNKGIVCLKPSNISFEEAAVAPAGALTALLHMQKVNLNKNSKILIYGASGSVGTYAVQIAKYYGAVVTAVCSTDNLKLVESIGADKVIDYTKEDFTQTNEVYDVVFDAVFKTSKSKCKKLLKQDGVYDSSHAKVRKLNTEDLAFLKELIETNKVKPVIDRIYPLEQIVDAHRYVDTGQKKGNVAIRIAK